MNRGVKTTRTAIWTRRVDGGGWWFDERWMVKPD